MFAIVYSIPSFIYAITEERHCLEEYGDAYRDYMNRTPRWIGIPKSAWKRYIITARIPVRAECNYEVGIECEATEEESVAYGYAKLQT